MDDIVKMAPKLSTQGMYFCQAITRFFGSVMPANRFPANMLRLHKLERWLKKVNK